MDLRCIDFDLREAIEDVLELLAERAASKGLELAYMLQNDSKPVKPEVLAVMLRKWFPPPAAALPSSVPSHSLPEG